MAKFNEDTRVKIPATIQFLRLGYDYQSLKDIDLHTETRIAVNRFKPAIEKINGRSFSDEEIQAIIADILSVIKNNDLGKAFYKWLINPQDRVMLNDGADGNDGLSGTERLASLRAKNDGISSLPDSPSQSSFASWEEVDDDEELPF